MEEKTKTKETINVTVDGKAYELFNPANNWEVYSLALETYIFSSKVKAGSYVFDACFTGGAEELVKIKSDIKLYANICLYTASYIDVLEGEVKKN